MLKNLNSQLILRSNPNFYIYSIFYLLQTISLIAINSPALASLKQAFPEALGDENATYFFVLKCVDVHGMKKGFDTFVEDLKELLKEKVPEELQFVLGYVNFQTAVDYSCRKWAVVK